MRYPKLSLPSVISLIFFVFIFLFPGLSCGSLVVCARTINLAVLDFGPTPLGRSTADRLMAQLKAFPDLSLQDRDVVRIAAHGAGYSGSLNLSLQEARDLGAAIGCDFYFIGDAQSLRRSTSNKPVYFESYASVFLVSARTGRLILWQRPSFEADQPAAAEQRLLDALSAADLASSFILALNEALKREKAERDLTIGTTVPVIEEAPDDEKAALESGLKLPKPYRRLRPPYPETAARADAEAVVDVLIDLDATGEVTRAEVTRWAGFGLDEATLSTVRRLHFFPAMRDGNRIPIRILLRYNFRKSAL